MSTTSANQPPAPEMPSTSEITADVEMNISAGVPEAVDLPRGKELSERSALALAQARPIHWVVLAGPVGCGKTTLLTSLYELFQWNEVPNHRFAGSATLPGFEERCFLSRTASDNLEPDTRRTVYDPVPTYLHLRTASTGIPQVTTDFLFTDVSGEMYEHARDSTTACRELTFLRRASTFLLFLDSKKSLGAEKRWSVVQEATTLLQSCLDSGMLQKDCLITVVWSRFDYFVHAGDTQHHKEFRTEVQESIQATFGARVPHLGFAAIAARPTKAPDLKIGYGALALFNKWTQDHPKLAKVNLSPVFAGGRESERYSARHFAEETS